MLTQKIQALLDEQVAGSPRARELLALLEGRRMRIVARHTPWELTLLAQEGRLRLLRGTGAATTAAPAAATPDAGASATADATLAGTPFALLALMREDPAAVIRRGDVTLAGDGEVGARFQELAMLLRPDLEAALSGVIGDIPAWGAGSLLRKALDFGRASITTQASNVGEYLAHERRLLVPSAEARQFIEEVDALREQTDRLAARVAQLEARETRP
jgi:ubiquinone biosynthesis protein UbiJ